MERDQTDWKRTVTNYLSDYYNEGDLKLLCGRAGVKWDDLGGNAVEAKGKIDGLLTKVGLLRTYHILLCEMTEEREPVFREKRLHTHLYEKGVELVDNWVQFHWLPLDEQDIDPKKCSIGAHLVFQTLRKVQEAYLQSHLSDDLKTRALALQVDGEWNKAQGLLEEFYGDLPNPTPISGVINEIREVQRLCKEIRVAIEKNDWGNAKSGYDSLMKAYPPCSSYSEVGKLQEEFEHPQKLLAKANEALSQSRWAEAEALKSDLLPRYETYPGIQNFIDKLEWPRQWLVEVKKLVDVKDWEGVKSALVGLPSEYKTYLGVLDLKQRIDNAEKLYQRARDEMSNQQWAQASKTLTELNSATQGFSRADQLLDSIKMGLVLIDKAKQQRQEKEWQAAQGNLEQALECLPQHDEAQRLLAQLMCFAYLYHEASKLFNEAKYDDALAMYQNLAKDEPNYKDCQEKLDTLVEWDNLFTEAGRLVEAKEWGEAEIKLKELNQQCPSYKNAHDLLIDVQLAELYAQASKFFDEAKYDDALAMYHDLAKAAPDYKDCQDKIKTLEEWERLFNKAVSHITAKEWGEAKIKLEEVNQQCPSGYKSAPDLLIDVQLAELYAQASGFFDEAKYDDALAMYHDLAKAVPDYRNTQKQLDKLNGWNELFSNAVRHVEAKEWDKAESKLRELNRRCSRGYRNAPGLLADVQRVIAIRAALQSPLIEDKHLVWEQGHSPYAILQGNGVSVSPATSMIEMDALYSSQAKRTVSAWDQLCSVEQRLFVDAYLYRVPQAGEMFAFIETIVAQDKQFPSDDKLAAEFAEAAPVAFLLMGQREPAVDKWRARQREQPRSGAPAHALALHCLANACQAEIKQDYTTAINEWRRALAQFALAINAPNYWREWGRERGETYGRAVLPNLIEELHQKIAADLSDRLSRRAEKFATEQRNDLAAQYQQLALDLKIEMDTTQLLKTQGGLALESGRTVVWFGPLFLDWEPALGQALAHHCANLFNLPAEFTTSPTSLLKGKTIESFARRLRLHFSSLKYATVWLETDSLGPENALKQLLRADCGECPKKACADATCTRHHDAASFVRLCCPACPNFNRHNPAYAQLPDPGQVLRLDALCLAMQACLKVAALHIDKHEESDSLDIILTSWQKAWELAQKCGLEVGTRQEIRVTALAGAAKLVGPSLAQHENTRRLDRAVALLDYLYQQESFQDRAILAGLAEHLTDRGVYQANHNEHREALKDVEKAYNLIQPTTDRTRDSYAAASIFVANDTIEDDPDEAQRLLAQAAQLIQEGKRLRPDYAEYASTQQLLEFVRQRMEGQSELHQEGDPLLDLRTLLGSMDTEKDTVAMLIAQVSDLRNTGKLTEALEAIENAWQQTPLRNDVQDELLITLAQRFAQTEAGRDSTEDARLYALWRERLAANPKATQRLNFVRWSPRLNRDLKQMGFIVHSSMQEFILPFEADNSATVMVRLTVEDALLRVTALLPFPSLEDETVLSNLLQVTGDIMFYKACSFETGGLALAAYVPLSNLSTGHLELLTRSLPRYVDTAPAVPGQLGTLRDHMLGAREVNRQQAQDANLPTPDLDSARILVQERGWRWEQIGAAAATFGPPGTGNAGGKSPSPWRAEANLDGFRFSTDLGYLRVGDLDLYQRLLRRNADLELGKLTLTAEARLQLAVELPLLDQAAFEMATQVLAANAEPLRRDLAQS